MIDVSSDLHIDQHRFLKSTHGNNIAVDTRFLSEDMGKTELVFKMQLAENANAAGCIRSSSQLHGQTDGLRYFLCHCPTHRLYELYTYYLDSHADETSVS